MLLAAATVLNTHGMTHILDSNLINSQVAAIGAILNVGYIIRTLGERDFGFRHERRWYWVGGKEV
jgi:hypothetical protein